MRHAAGMFRAITIVVTSMMLGAMLALAYAWIVVPAKSDRVGILIRAGVPARVIAGLSRDGEASKSTIFDERVVAGIYERTAPAVVAISNVGEQRQGLGSGIIVRADGIVLTNYHVVRGARRLDVALSDRARYTAQTLGIDPPNDLAVLRLMDAPAGLPVIPLGDSTKLRPGMLAVAIGNPSGLERSVSVGVISGLNRTLRPAERALRDVIQTDAAINPGNSGGPLLNSQGELVGINTAIERSPGQPGFGGIGFAVPAATALRYLDQMIAGETIQHPWLGIRGNTLTPANARERGLALQGGVLIAEAMPESPASAIGLQVGDVLVAVDGQPIQTMDDLGERMDRANRPGDRVVLGIARGAQRLELGVTLGAWPESLPPT